MNDAHYDLKKMKAAVETIEPHALKLQASGAGIAAVEKNARIILSAVHNLRFAIVDPADLMDQ